MSRAQSPLNAAQVVARVAGQAIAPATIATGRFVAAETSWSPNQAIVDRPAPNTARIAAVGTGAGPGNRGTLLLSVVDEGAANYFNAVSIGPDGGTTVNNTLVVGTGFSGTQALRVGGAAAFRFDADARVDLSTDGINGAFMDAVNGAASLFAALNIRATDIRLAPQGGGVVVGTDPGGSELLRVNGGGRFSAKITVAGQSTATLATLADVIAFLQAIHN
jgi:hypothetical protein